jgi:hypothetical protein
MELSGEKSRDAKAADSGTNREETMKLVGTFGQLAGVGALLAGCASNLIDSEDLRQKHAALDPEEEEGECLVGDHELEHACVHAEFGPFDSVVAQPYPGTITSEISTPHTAYTVTLAGAASSYSGGTFYFPTATGEFAFFVNPESTLTLYDSSDTLVEPLDQGPVEAEVCSFLSEVKIYELSDTEFYTVVFGPEDDPSLLTIVEYLGEHRECESCEEVHLKASMTTWPPSREDGQVSLDHPIAFEIPEVIAVTEGESSGGLVSLKFSSGGGPAMKCWYFGTFSSPEQFNFLQCTGGLEPGDDAEADYFRLRVDFGGVTGGGETEVELEIEDEACHSHDDDDHDGDHDDHEEE